VASQLVIALAGRIDSGKSSVADVLSGCLEIPVLSFGDYVRSQTREGAQREELQEVGGRLVETLGPQGLLSAVREAKGLGGGDSAIWEGVRHLSVLNSLRADYSPTAVSLFFLSPPEAERLARAKEEAGSPDRLATWERHSTENLDALRPEADLEVEKPTPTEAANHIIDFIRSQ
jgi:hypothetical protein